MIHFGRGSGSFRVKSVEVFRGHVSQRAAQPGGIHLRQLLRCERQVEIGQQGPAELIHQNVRRLDVAVQNTLVVSIIQGLGQAGPDPADGLNEVRLRQKLTVAQGGGVKRGGMNAQGIDHLEDGTSAPGAPRQGLNDPFQRRTRHVLHAQQAPIPLPIHLFGKDADDMVVLQAGQNARFAAPQRRHLQGYEPIQGELPGQEDFAERALAQKLEVGKIADPLPGLGKRQSVDRAGCTRYSDHCPKRWGKVRA